VKTIGLIGGLSWHSSAEYYRIINEEVQKQRGDAHSAQLILYSFNFQEVIELQKQNRTDQIEELVIQAGKKLLGSGADLIALCANTAHRFADALEAQVSLPLVHVADVTAAAILEKGLRRVALLGTKPTMQLDFYKRRLLRYGIESIVPSAEKMELLHSIIFSELAKGVFTAESRTSILEMIDACAEIGAEGAILGCTELPLIVKSGDSTVPLFDTTRLHAEAIVRAALGE
jgi:aspartate racemase